MGDLKDKVVYFLDDYKKYILIALVGLSVIFLAYTAMSDKKNEENGGKKVDIVEDYEKMVNESKELSYMFSEFSTYNVGYSTRFPAYEINLFLKQPFVSKKDFDNAISEYIKLLKWKVNDEKTKTYLAGVKINIYDREIIYREGLEPRAVVEYKLAEEDKKKKKQEDEFMADMDLRWEHTLTQTKEPEYTEYRLSNNFRSTKKDTNVVTLSDEEFEFLLKLNKYSAVNDRNVNAGIRTYLEWDMGRDLSKSGISSILREFYTFTDRHLSSGGQNNYYTNTYELRKELAVENPRFLVYALTREIVEDELTAKRRLIQIDPKEYLDVYIADAKKKILNGEDDETTIDAITLGELDEEEEDYDDNQYGLVEDEIGESIEEFEMWVDNQRIKEPENEVEESDEN